MGNRIKVFILDDNIPKTPAYVDQSVYDGPINSDQLIQLVESEEWTGEKHLKQLTSYILNSSEQYKADIEIWAFTHPSLCLDAIDSGLIPDIIIYDWEYGIEPHVNSSNWLKEIMDLTSAFIFVYSMVRDEIPHLLNKPEYEKFSHRFQLFLKGSDSNSVFSSEEFILQYVLNRIKQTSTIRIQGMTIPFNENSYLDSPSDILYIEKVLGKANLIHKLKNSIDKISDETIELILEDLNITIYYDAVKNILVLGSSKLMLNKIENKVKISITNVLKNYGLKNLMELLEIGIIKIDP
ncbi:MULTISPECIES: hypothetical protein [unclassified Arenibacter]|uniref:hypothetical protein n=1 Tax=unclassified Arenibacter TaxID=2615047 RepID=UPI000E34A41F|nr:MULTISPECIES: hypothetical protein [unclassified Arenibacter]MCM4162456.1 hypothetical protein [Arenibacter sp. A80]RFT58048.1 hypothetical protein D0S24_02490 [Arenibacter sp. P308M17]